MDKIPEEMRPRPDWWKDSYTPVIEFLGDHELAVPVGVIEIAFDESNSSYPGRRSIIRAVKGLEEHGLVDRHPKKQSFIRITDRGRRYLEGDITVAELERDAD